MSRRLPLLLLACLLTFTSAAPAAAANLPHAAAARPAVRPQVTLRLPVPIIFEGDMPDLQGLIADRQGLRMVRVAWGQGTVSVWRSSMSYGRTTRMAPMDPVDADFSYQRAGQYTIRVTAVNLRGKTTTRTIPISIEPYTTGREAEICAQYDCGETDAAPEVS
jgi:hypothetical protein